MAVFWLAFFRTTLISDIQTTDMDDWISLNVGGRLFECSRGTLISDPKSALAKMFETESGLSPARTADGVFCLDADPDCFKVDIQRESLGCNSCIIVGYFDLVEETSAGSSTNFISHSKSTPSRGKLILFCA